MSKTSRSSAGTAPVSPVLVETSRALPLVDVVVVLRSGAAHDPAGKEGTARIAVRTLRCGTRSLSADDVELRLDSLGAELGASVSASSVAFHLQVIRRNLEPALALLGGLLTRPAFRTVDLERVRRELLADLVEARDNDQSLAFRFFRQALFAGHAYGRPIGGFSSTVRAVTRGEAEMFHRTHFAAPNAVVGFSGDIDAEEADRLARKHLLALPGTTAPRDVVREPTPPRERRVLVVDKPERTQTQVLVGTLGTRADDEDHDALVVANTVFGGTFTARLTNEVRSKRGWSYGASSRLGRDRHREAWWMWTFPAAKDAAACLGLQLSLFDRWVDKGITRKELSFAKSYLVKSHAFEIDTAEKRLEKRIDAAAN
ncbi:MAG: insulinase family protein, partial [Deltaproteobacteria bacterium]|nr:insulinase family protein [Deltaproteobacteria bacterium]